MGEDWLSEALRRGEITVAEAKEIERMEREFFEERRAA